MPKMLLVLGIPFALVGSFVLFLAISWWISYADSASWQRVPVTVSHNEVITSRDSEGATSYRNEIIYNYTINGISYSGERMGVESGGSSGGHHQRRQREIQKLTENGEPILAWVNPRKPQQSFLYRETTITMFVLLPFGLVFFLVGAGLSGAVLLSIWNNVRLRRAPTPWQGEGIWQDNAARSAPWKSVFIGLGHYRDFRIICVSICPPLIN